MPLNIDWQQILLHLLNFAILAGGLYILLYKPVRDFMDKREAGYAQREAEIKKAGEDAAALKAEYETKLRQAEENIQRERMEHQLAMEDEKQLQLAKAREEARNIIATASKTAELRSKKIIEDARDEVRAMAEDMVEKLVIQSGGDALDRFLDEAEGGEEDG